MGGWRQGFCRCVNREIAVGYFALWFPRTRYPKSKEIF
jgi:hypothetical protein